MLMQALAENMSEGSSEMPEVPAPETTESRLTLPVSKASFSNLPGTQLIPTKDQSVESTAKKVHIFMVFRFTMDSLIINLLSGGSETVSQQNKSFVVCAVGFTLILNSCIIVLNFIVYSWKNHQWTSQSKG